MNTISNKRLPFYIIVDNKSNYKDSCNIANNASKITMHYNGYQGSLRTP